MAAISGVAWKTAQPFPQKHALRVCPHPNPLPKGAGRFARIFVLDGSGDKRQLLLQRTLSVGAAHGRDQAGTIEIPVAAPARASTGPLAIKEKTPRSCEENAAFLVLARERSADCELRSITCHYCDRRRLLTEAAP